VEYYGSTPEQRFETANEIHIPVGRKVRLQLEGLDVIHSFWVPSLAGKQDLVPGRPNELTLRAERPGVYRGQCAEFCGLQHAHMAFYVYADPPSVFRRWLAQQEKPAAAQPPAVFESAGCADCHSIRGTTADAHVGPDLTHVASRTTLGALAIPNDRAHLEKWIVDSQHVKPGNQMPNFNLSQAQLTALADYLEARR
jgi:cytochrome c oxidase subunit 2